MKEALELAQSLGDVQGELHCLINLARVKRSLGDSDDMDLLERAQQLAQAQGDRLVQATVLQELGASHEAQGDLQTALVSYEDAHHTAMTLDHQPGVLSALMSLGELHVRLQDDHRARQVYEEALEAASYTGDRVARARILQRLGRLHESKEEWHRALEAYREAYETSTNIDKKEALLSWLGMARALRRIGEANLGIPVEIEEIVGSLGDPRLSLLVELERAAIAEATDQFDLAFVRYSSILETAERLKENSILFEVLTGMARNSARNNRQAKAMELYGAALEVAEQLHDPKLVRKVEGALASLQHEQSLLSKNIEK